MKSVLPFFLLGLALGLFIMYGFPAIVFLNEQLNQLLGSFR